MLRRSLLPVLLREIVQRRRVTIVVYHAPRPDVFDAHLTILRRVYNIVSLAEYVAARETGTTRRLPSKALVITVDDGHRSNYALKSVIEKHGIPVTIFLCSGVIGTSRRFWFLHAPTAHVVQALKAVPDDDRRTILQNAGWDETREFEERQALSDSEIDDLKASVDFQSHTIFHPILPQCPTEKAHAEIAGSKRDLEERLGSDIYAFAYPNGSYADRDAQLAAKAGYRCALTLDSGLNSDSTPLFKLRRIALSDDADEHELLVKASGLWAVKTAAAAAKVGIHALRHARMASPMTRCDE